MKNQSKSLETGLAENSEYIKELIYFLRELAPQVIDGHPSSTPYSESIITHHPYITLSHIGIQEEGELSVGVKSLEDAIILIKHHMTKYCKGKSRIIVRSWPTLVKRDNLTREKPLYFARCRLLADDGTAELKQLTITRKDKAMKNESKGEPKESKLINQHKRLAMGDKVTGMKKGGKVNSDEAEDKKLVKKMVKKEDLKMAKGGMCMKDGGKVQKKK